MAEPAGPGAGATPILGGLPDEIAIWEILARLPPKPLLRCRAVCRAWRRATFAREFLLAHHGRQRCLPLICGEGFRSGHSGSSDCLDIVTVDHQAAAAAQLQPVARLDDVNLDVDATCDGLLILSDSRNGWRLSVCNPATRQYARLQLRHPCMPLGMYLHQPSGEYRLLLCLFPETEMHVKRPPGYQNACFVFALGSGERLRQIRGPEAEELRPNESLLVRDSGSVLVCGSLHWYQIERESATNNILVFDTTDESFRQMRAPVVLGIARLFEMDGMLGMSRVNEEATIVDIWVMKDYEREIWAFRCRVELPVAEIRVQFGKYECRWNWNVVVMPHGELFVLVESGDWLLQVDMDSKLVGSFHRKRLGLTEFQLKQTLVQHAFFRTLEGYVVNALPFI